MINLLIIFLMSLLSRASGGGFFAPYLEKKGVGKGVMPINLSFLPELAFAGVIAFAVYPVYGLLISLMCWAWSYLWMQTGHGTVLPWGEKSAAEIKDRSQFLTPAVTFIAKILKIEKFKEDGYSRTINYCRLFMAVKGFLIGLPLGGIPLAIMWPLGYEIGARLKDHKFSELLAGAGAGISIIIFKIIGG
jgi:hypothetical protein